MVPKEAFHFTQMKRTIWSGYRVAPTEGGGGGHIAVICSVRGARRRHRTKATILKLENSQAKCNYDRKFSPVLWDRGGNVVSWSGHKTAGGADMSDKGVLVTWWEQWRYTDLQTRHSGSHQVELKCLNGFLVKLYEGTFFHLYLTWV